jgi:TRAP-type C4-dicarboxylate transport system permease small subunit
MSFAIIIVIGWLYVTVLIAANEPSIAAGIISFLFYGALPCGLILYFATSKIRRQRRAFKESQESKKSSD